MSSTDRIEREIVIAAPVDRVWEVLTRAEHLGSWFADAGAEIDLRPGGSIALHWEQHGTALGRVEDVVPGERLAMRWAASPDVEPAEGNETHVEFRLLPDADGTRLRVVEHGFDALDLPPDERAAKRAGNVEGWEIELGHLSEHALRQAV